MSATQQLKPLLWCALLAVLGMNLRAQSPYSATQPAGPVGRTGATLNGMSTARGSETVAWFEWGTDANYGFNTAKTNVGASLRVARVSLPITGLTPGTSYHYRLVSSNSFGTTLGADAILVTGTKVTTWTGEGYSYYLHPNILPDLTNIVAQACGHNHALALTTEGTVVSWGVGLPKVSYDPASTNVPSGLSNVVMVAGGYSHSLALRQDGTVAIWGPVWGAPPTLPASITNVIAIAGGDSQSVVLKADGTVVTWSGGTPSAPPGATNVVAIAAGANFGLALKADGTVVGWGYNIGPVSPPAGLTNVVAISAETWHSLALRSDGTVVAWGDTSYGKATVPVGLSNVVAISAGFTSSLALKSDGTLVAWGQDTYVTNVPVTLSNVVAICSGDYHSQALSPMNLPPFAYDRTYVGGVTKNLTMGLPAWDPNGDPVTFRVSSIPTNGTLFQYNAGGPGDAIVVPDTPLADATCVVFTPVAGAWSAPYSTFKFIANDGQADSTPGIATVNILPQPTIQYAGYVTGTNPGFAVSWSAVPQVSYGVWYSTNLLNWKILSYPVEVSPGQYYFVDTDATNQARRFYRVQSR